MAIMTIKMIDRIWGWTNACYREALLEEYAGFWSLCNEDWLKQATVEDLKSQLIIERKEHRSPSINNRYIAKLIRLPSDQLSLIVEAHQKGKIMRKEITIEAILTELMERAANGEG